MDAVDNKNNNKEGTFSITDQCVRKSSNLERAKIPSAKEKSMLAPSNRPVMSRADALQLRNSQNIDKPSNDLETQDATRIHMSTKECETFLGKPYPIAAYNSVQHFIRRHEWIDQHFGTTKKQPLTTLKNPKTTKPEVSALPDPDFLRAARTQRCESSNIGSAPRYNQPFLVEGVFQKVVIEPRNPSPDMEKIKTHHNSHVHFTKPTVVPAQESKNTSPTQDTLFPKIERIPIAQVGHLKGCRNNTATQIRGLELLDKIPQNKAIAPLRKMIERNIGLNTYRPDQSYIEYMDSLCTKQ